jgi:hypothetical protein
VAVFSWAPADSGCCRGSIGTVGPTPMFTPGND